MNKSAGTILSILSQIKLALRLSSGTKRFTMVARHCSPDERISALAFSSFLKNMSILIINFYKILKFRKILIALIPLKITRHQGQTLYFYYFIRFCSLDKILQLFFSNYYFALLYFSFRTIFIFRKKSGFIMYRTFRPFVLFNPK